VTFFVYFSCLWHENDIQTDQYTLLFLGCLCNECVIKASGEEICGH